MNYLISDIHGNLKGLLRLLEMISFNEKNDKLTILGDIFDSGPDDGIRLLRFLGPYLKNGSMQLLMGNHELFAIMYMAGELTERKWSIFGGDENIKAIKALSDAERNALSEYLEGLPYYVELMSPQLGDIVATHTGLDAENLIINSDNTIDVKKSIEAAAANNLYKYMIGTDLHYEIDLSANKPDKYMIVGHVPCYRLNPDMSNKFYRTDTYMVIDAGAAYTESGGTLGCYCLDTDEEIYL